MFDGPDRVIGVLRSELQRCGAARHRGPDGPASTRRAATSGQHGVMPTTSTPTATAGSPRWRTGGWRARRTTATTSCATDGRRHPGPPGRGMTSARRDRWVTTRPTSTHRRLRPESAAATSAEGALDAVSCHEMGGDRSLPDADYEELLRFRDALRRFLRWSEDRAKQAGMTAAQHQLLLAIRGHGGHRPSAACADRLLLRHHSVVELVDRAQHARAGEPGRRPRRPSGHATRPQRRGRGAPHRGHRRPPRRAPPVAVGAAAAGGRPPMSSRTRRRAAPPASPARRSTSTSTPSPPSSAASPMRWSSPMRRGRSCSGTRPPSGSSDGAGARRMGRSLDLIVPERQRSPHWAGTTP